MRGFVFGYSGNGVDTFIKHTKSWGLGANPVPRREWPDRVYNLGQEFAMVPTAGTVEPEASLKGDSTNGIYMDKAVVRSFLTAALQAINLANVRGFLTADTIGDPKETF